MSQVVVRRLVPDDWQLQRDLRLAGLADAPSAFITTLEQARDHPEQFWRDRIAANPHLVVFVDGEPVGMAVGVVLDDQPQVVGVWVAPGSRGSGAIEALLDGTVEWAQEEGFGELALWVVDENARARRAYERYGFAPTGRTQPVPGRPEETEVELVYAVRRRWLR